MSNQECSTAFGERMIVSIVVVAVLIFSLTAYNMISGPVDAGLAAKQVEDSVVTYALAKEAAEGSLVPSVMVIIAFVLMVITWLLPTAWIDGIAAATKDLFKK